MKRLNLDLRSPNAEDILNQFRENWGDDRLNVLPNLPLVKDLVKPWIVQENHFWLITFDISLKIWNYIDKKGLVPYHGYNDSIETIQKNFYNSNSKLW